MSAAVPDWLFVVSPVEASVTTGEATSIAGGGGGVLLGLNQLWNVEVPLAAMSVNVAEVELCITSDDPSGAV